MKIEIPDSKESHCEKCGTDSLFVPIYEFEDTSYPDDEKDIQESLNWKCVNCGKRV